MRRYRREAKAAKLETLCFHDPRYASGTAMAAAGVPMRTLMVGCEGMRTALIHADFVTNAHEVEMVGRAFAASPVLSSAQARRAQGSASPGSSKRRGGTRGASRALGWADA